MFGVARLERFVVFGVQTKRREADIGMMVCVTGVWEIVERTRDVLEGSLESFETNVGQVAVGDSRNSVN